MEAKEWNEQIHLANPRFRDGEDSKHSKERTQWIACTSVRNSAGGWGTRQRMGPGAPATINGCASSYGAALGLAPLGIGAVPNLPVLASCSRSIFFAGDCQDSVLADLGRRASRLHLAAVLLTRCPIPLRSARQPLLGGIPNRMPSGGWSLRCGLSCLLADLISYWHEVARLLMTTIRGA